MTHYPPECPICLEAADDAVLTPCAHSMCRECLLAAWQAANSQACPVCRYAEYSASLQNVSALLSAYFLQLGVNFLVIVALH